MAELPPDQPERRRIVEDLDHTLFVEAGAGSGKTGSLVERVFALVAAGVPMRDIAAITFTDKAAAELRDRIRRRLEDAALGLGADDTGTSDDTDDTGTCDETSNAGSEACLRARLGEALAELDGAAVSTVHAFAQRLLTELPLAAGLPPRVEVADELTSQLTFDERWAAFLDDLLDPDRLEVSPEEHDALLVLLEARRPIAALRAVALEFERNWDLVAHHVHGQPPPPLATIEVGGLLAQVRSLAEERVHGAEGDRLVRVLDVLANDADDLEAAATPRDQLRVLARLGERRGRNTGSKPNWRFSRWADDLDALRAQVEDVASSARALARGLTEACLRRLAHRLAHTTMEAAEERRRSGRLAFHDLLVLARGLLRDPERGPEARAVLHQRYTRLLLDEFQDTDPIQVDIALLLAADPHAPIPPGSRPAGGAGRLFFVGDPQQSIYRFRRADIATFLATRDALDTSPVRLSANFRTNAPVVEWVNAVFDQLFEAAPGAQPEFAALAPTRSTPLAGPAVATLGSSSDEDRRAPEVRALESGDVVAAIRAAVGRWELDDQGARRPVRFGDIAVLIPTRTILDSLEDALETAGVPYRTESSSLAYASREVRDLLLALRAVDDPTDELALITALRSPLFGCSDVDLYRWRHERDGRWNILVSRLPEPEEHDPVHDAFTSLRALAGDRHWAAPAELLLRLVDERRVLEVAVGSPRARDVWRRVRYVIDQARAWREAGGGTLRAYLAWATRQASDSVRVTEAVLPETDHDAVRVMTIHAAKGLEFPVVIVAGLTARPRRNRGGVDVIWTATGPEFRLDDTFATRDYEITRALDEQLDEHERRRLLYVACTRARDHLVVSLHSRRQLPDDPPSWTLAELLAAACATVGGHQPLDGPEPSPPPPAERPSPSAAAIAPRDLDEWTAERQRVLAAAGRPRTVAATYLDRHLPAEERAGDDPGLAKGAVDLDQPPWQRGRYGTAIGRAVHAVLQTIDLRSGDGLEAAAAAQASAEGVEGREATIRALAASAVASRAVRDAVDAAGYWREVLVASPVGDTLLEGYIDLLYRTPDGLVVVDYKTDQPKDDIDLAARVARYRTQLAAYATAVAAVTGEPVRRAVLVFCRTEGPALERDVPDLAGAMAEVAATLRATTAGTLQARLV